jgi:catechol 2,3-dioxygenase-like lactoylglutathione lyase family enzyme
MLANARFETALPCLDLERAKLFYSAKLGLEPVAEEAAGAFYGNSGSTRFLLFRSTDKARDSNARMHFVVTDVAAEVRDLKGRDVRFEEYEFPGFDKETSIAKIAGRRMAWFRDSEGNLLGITQQE